MATPTDNTTVVIAPVDFNKMRKLNSEYLKDTKN